ncbi:MAG: hypothetical protein RI897_2035 [Verrucomicrobiota bacterium]|jgi:hypothetical protein
MAGLGTLLYAGESGIVDAIVPDFFPVTSERMVAFRRCALLA